MKKIILTAALAAMAILGMKAQTPKYLDPKAPLEERVQDALSRMTTHEKVQILHAHGKFWSAGVPRLGIRGLWHSDGPHGARAEVNWNDWANADWTNDSIVAFPSLTCLAATWNPELARLFGEKVSEEFAFRGKDILLGPGTTIQRNPLCGRSFEYMGEDPYLAGEMAVPYIQAVQKNGVACCLKHFFLNNQEEDRMAVNVNVSERAIREIYLPAFKKCVEKAGLWTIMGSYNRWQNVHCCQHDRLLNKILKQEWGFDGAVVSDWGGTHNTWEAALGGLDIEMGSYTDGKTADKSWGWHTYYLANPFERLIEEGKIPMSVLDDKATRVLRTIFRTSMNPDKIIGKQCSEDHYEACQAIGEEGIVLLKNAPAIPDSRNPKTENRKSKTDNRKSKIDNRKAKNAPILPLNADLYQKILVVGENATRNLSEGGGSSELKTLKDYLPLDELKAVYGEKIDYAQGYYSGKPLYAKQEPLDEKKQKALHDEAVEKAKQADLVIFIGGLNKNGNQDCEGADRKSYDLSFGQNELISDLADACKNVIVVCNGGNPYSTPWIDKVQGFIHCWYLGSMCGRSLANVISGKVNPSGKLPMTFAVKQEDYPCFQYGKEGYPGVDHQVYYKEGIYVGYRHFNTNNVAPRFPFGYGLSYTTFKYGKPAVQTVKNGEYVVTVDVTNTGDREGKEIVQLYIGDDECSVDRPVKELKGFKKVALKAGESKLVTFQINKEDLAFFSEKENKFVAEPGTFKAYVCASETDVRGVAEFELK